MSLPGDEWKQEGDRVRLTRRTRAEQQEHADHEYAAGRITLDQWRLRWSVISGEDATGLPITT